MRFRDRVYQITKEIPNGKVATYGQIARLAGNSKGSRAVGGYMKNNPFAPAVPCHRVVGFDGKLTGYSGNGGVTAKRKMLIAEGVKFLGNKVDMQNSWWKR